jgi:asparagine synthetase B (glutamine-hydrolysing)
MALPSPGHHLTTHSASVQRLEQELIKSLKLRVLAVPEPPRVAGNRDVRIAVLFSGGLDCTVLARLTSDLLPLGQGIDLINVAFENPRIAAQRQNVGNEETSSIFEACPDRATGWNSFRELVDVCPNRSWRLVTVSLVSYDRCTR